MYIWIQTKKAIFDKNIENKLMQCRHVFDTNVFLRGLEDTMIRNFGCVPDNY